MDITEINAAYLRGEYESAAKSYREAARDGDPDGAFNYAYCLWRGIGVAKDSEEAKSFFAFARDVGEGEACYNLAVMYMHGDGVVRDFSRSLAYMRASADMGCIEAQLYLGMVYTTGFYLEPDIIGITRIPFHRAEMRTGAPLLTGSVEDAEAEEDARSFVVDANAREAFEYFRSAAYHDPTYVSDLVAKGQFLYAKCYVDGLGTDHDLKKATRLMLAAGKSGSQDAVEYLKSTGMSVSMLLDAAK